MAKVTLKFKGLDSLVKKKIVTKKFQQKLGTRVLKDIKALIAIGKSPVAGQGRYVGYKVDRATSDLRGDLGKAKGKSKKGLRSEIRRETKRIGAKKNLYPNSVKDEFPGKQKRPVNLELSGKMIKAIKWKGLVGGIKIGLISASKKIKDRFEAHNEGTNTAKGVPRRAVLPVEDGEKFTIGIRRRIRSLFLARIRQIIRKNNRR